jgi:hypothetical protein
MKRDEEKTLCLCILGAFLALIVGCSWLINASKDYYKQQWEFDKFNKQHKECIKENKHCQWLAWAYPYHVNLLELRILELEERLKACKCCKNKKD